MLDDRPRPLGGGEAYVEEEACDEGGVEDAIYQNEGQSISFRNEVERGRKRNKEGGGGGQLEFRDLLGPHVEIRRQ